MSKILRFVPIVLLTIFSLKILGLSQLTFESATILLIFSLLTSFFEYKTNQHEFTQIKKELEEQNRKIKELTDIQESLKSSVSSLKIATNMKTQMTPRF